MTKNLKITGIKEIDKKLSQLEPKVIKKALRQSIRPALKDNILPKVKANVSKDSGALKKAVKMKSGKRSRISVSAQVEASTETYKGDGQFPGAFTEYGTKFQTPSGAWRRAFDQNADKAKADAMKNLRKILDQSTK